TGHGGSEHLGRPQHPERRKRLCRLHRRLSQPVRLPHPFPKEDVSYVIGFYGVKDGQGVTTTAVGMACELARRHTVLFLDADMSGTGTAVDLLQLDPEGRGMNNLIGARSITAGDLLAQAVGTPFPKMGLVPGLIAVCESALPRLVEQLQGGSAFQIQGVEFVVVDFGTVAHPEQRSLRQAVAAIA